MNCKKIVRIMVTGAVILGFGDLTYHAGKGTMLAVLAHHNVTATDMKKILSEDNEKPYPTKVILGVCKIQEECFTKRNGA